MTSLNLSVFKYKERVVINIYLFHSIDPLVEDQVKRYNGSEGNFISILIDYYLKTNKTLRLNGIAKKKLLTYQNGISN